MKTLILAAIRCSLMFIAVAAPSIVHPTSVQAVPTTYQYTGHFFDNVFGVYTTSDFVTGMVTLASPLGPNHDLNAPVTVTCFRFSDGVQTLTSLTGAGGFSFGTDATGAITEWQVVVFANAGGGIIETILDSFLAIDHGELGDSLGENLFSPGVWTTGVPAPDTGSTLSLMTLTLMALGVVARRFKRAAG